MILNVDTIAQTVDMQCPNCTSITQNIPLTSVARDTDHCALLCGVCQSTTAYGDSTDTTDPLVGHVFTDTGAVVIVADTTPTVQHWQHLLYISTTPPQGILP